MKKLIFTISLSLLLVNLGFSQSGPHLQADHWDVMFETDRENIVKSKYNTDNELTSSKVFYLWDDVLIFSSKKASKNSYICIEDEDGEVIKRFETSKSKGKCIASVSFSKLKDKLKEKTNYRFVINDKKLDSPISINFSVSKELPDIKSEA